MRDCVFWYVFFFRVTATPGIYTYVHTVSLHAALPISRARVDQRLLRPGVPPQMADQTAQHGHGPRPGIAFDDVEPSAGLVERLLYQVLGQDRKSTRLNSSH